MRSLSVSLWVEGLIAPSIIAVGNHRDTPRLYRLPAAPVLFLGGLGNRRILYGRVIERLR